MTHPPYDGQPAPDPGTGGWQQQPSYPRQDLTPQHVQPGRSRLPLVIAAIAVLVAVVGGLGLWWILHDDGEQNRAAYCASLRTLTHDGDLSAITLNASGGSATALLSEVQRLAPAAVVSEWDDLVSLLVHPPTGQPDIALGARLVTDLQAIVSDARDKCALTIEFPR